MPLERDVRWVKLQKDVERLRKTYRKIPRELEEAVALLEVLFNVREECIRTLSESALTNVSCFPKLNSLLKGPEL